MSRKSRSSSSSAAGAPPAPGGGGLLCPRCAAAHAAHERFCARCAMPLVVDADAAAAEAPASEVHARARKVRPELARGELVRVAGGRNQAEAELIGGLLLEEGIPSLVRRAAGSDVPDFLAAGQRDVLVAESGAGTAREVLAQVEAAAPAPRTAGSGAGGPSHALRLAAAIAISALVAAFVAWILVTATL